MQEKLIDCHCCCRCNELTVAYDKAMAHFKRLQQADESFGATLNGPSSIDALRSRIVLQREIDEVEKAAANGLRNSLVRLKDDLDFDRIRGEFEVQIMKLNVVGSAELLDAIQALRTSAQEQLDASAHMLPDLQKTLEESYAKARNAFKRPD